MKNENSALNSSSVQQGILTASMLLGAMIGSLFGTSIHSPTHPLTVVYCLFLILSAPRTLRITQPGGSLGDALGRKKAAILLGSSYLLHTFACALPSLIVVVVVVAAIVIMMVNA